MGERSISGVFRPSHGSLVGHQLFARQTDIESSTVIMQPDLGEIFWVSLRVLNTATTERDHLCVEPGDLRWLN